MASEKSEYSIKPIMEIQTSAFGLASGYQCLMDDLKKSKEKILKLEIQLKAANDTIIQQEDQLVKAKTILGQVEKLGDNSTQTIHKLKEDLEIERRGRRNAEEKVQQLGEQVDRMKMLTKVEMKQDSLEGENIIDISMETDDFNCNPDNNQKDNGEVYSSTVIIGGEVYKNLTENDDAHCSPGENDNSFRTELQIIESTLLKYVNRLVAKESKPYKRQKCLNKVIRTTEKLVSSLSTMVSEEWASYTIKCPESPESSESSPLPSLYSPIHVLEEISTEATSGPLAPLNLPSSLATPMEPEEKSIEKMGHEIDTSNINKCHCGHQSTNQEALLKHINREVNGKLFKCEICGNRSRDTSALNLHVQRVHGVKSEYANGCGKCGKTFASKDNLRKHMSTHQKSGNVLDLSAIKIRVHH